ncbi:MAG: HupE/UreJ family protein [Xanthobacteraceae bacterium]|nr:HupE/UreJ family protein [Xanthobacteraceae bacterium]
MRFHRFEGLRRVVTALVALLACAIAFGAAAHEIPNDVKINAFFKPDGQRAYLLMRVPLAAMVEVEYPTRGPGYLDLARADEALRGAIKLYLTDNITVFESDAPLTPRVASFRVSLPSDKSFGSYESALVNVQGPPLPGTMDLYWNQQFIDVLFEYPIQSDRSEFAIQLRVDRFAQKVTTTLRFLTPDGATRAFEFHGDPGVIVFDPRWYQAAMSFVVSGFWHILEGIDHLLFLLCLVLPFRRLRPLVIIVTAFTVGHSISLIAAALGFVPDALWFPPLVETLIAVTIVYMALENIVQAAKGTLGDSGVEYRWILAFAFGVVHGFGFSFALRESLQFSGEHLVLSLFAFNLGVEIGQIAVLLVLIPALSLLFRFVVPERIGIIIISALVTHTAWHWMLERGGQLAKFPFPRLDAAFMASAMRGLMAALILAALVWAANSWLKRWIAPDALRKKPTS